MIVASPSADDLLFDTTDQRQGDDTTLVDSCAGLSSEAQLHNTVCLHRDIAQQKRNGKTQDQE